jgi:hypothetical protein
MPLRQTITHFFGADRQGRDAAPRSMRARAAGAAICLGFSTDLGCHVPRPNSAVDARTWTS